MARPQHVKEKRAALWATQLTMIELILPQHRNRAFGLAGFGVAGQLVAEYVGVHTILNGIPALTV